MKAISLTVMLAVLAATWVGCSTLGGKAAKSVVLVRDGKPEATIVVNQKPTKMAMLAASELQWHVEQITGAKIPIIREPVAGVTNTEAIHGLAIYIGESAKVRELGLKGHAFSEREFVVQFIDGGIVLTGSEDWSGNIEGAQPLAPKIELFDMGGNRGPLFATYEFIENYLGVRWYAPGNENICWPAKTKTLSVVAKDVRRKPVIRERNTAWGMNADAWGKPGPTGDEVNLFKLRNKVAGAGWISHSFEGWPERFMQTNSPVFESYHPEYFSKDQGDGQICFSSTGTLAQVIKDARRWADGKGITHRACVGEDWYGIEPRDTPVRCTCDVCKPLLQKDEGFNSGEASMIVWSFADKVARALQESNPGKSVGLLAYGNHAGCPTNLNLATNIYVGMAVFPRGAPNMNEPDWKKFAQWSAKLPGRLESVWLYPCFPREGAGIQGYTAFPKVEAHGLNKQMRVFADNKVRDFMFCGAYDTIIDFWASVKYQDNPYVDADADVHEFFTRYYGAAAGPMEKWYNGVESASEGAPDLGERNSWEYCGTDARMAEWQTLMDQATALAKTDLEKKRVANVRDNLWAEMLKGKKNWAFKSKYQADVDALKKLPPMDTNAVRLVVAPAGGDARNVDWKNVLPVNVCRTIDGYPALNRTADLYVAHDGVNLYVRLTDHVDADKLGDSGGPWWGDRWEIFLSSQRNTKAGQSLEDRNKGDWGPYRQIGVRPNANAPDLWTSEFEGPHKDDWGYWPKLDLKLHNEKSKDGWTFYLTIPLKDISVNGPVKPGEWVYFNFIGPNGSAGSTLSLSPTFNPGAYHNVPRLAGFHLAP